MNTKVEAFDGAVTLLATDGESSIRYTIKTLKLSPNSCSTTNMGYTTPMRWKPVWRMVGSPALKIGIALSQATPVLPFTIVVSDHHS